MKKLLSTLLAFVTLAIFAAPAFSQAALTRYYCDCATLTGAYQADPSCPTNIGSESNNGLTASTPKLILPTQSAITALGAGSNVRLCRGGAFNGYSVLVENANSTAALPLTFESYTPPSGATAQPILRHNSSTGIVFNVGLYGANRAVKAGLVWRGLKFVGQGVSGGAVAIQVNGRINDVLVENNTFEGFWFPFYNNDGGNGVTSANRYKFLNNVFYRNPGMGYLGASNDTLFYGNLFEENNNLTGSGFQHAIYVGASGGARNFAIINNIFRNNSTISGVCQGGNVTAHGVINDLRIQGNLITVQASAPGCYGISLTPGYGTAETLNRVWVDSNVVEGVGNNYITVSMSVGAVITRNLVLQRPGQSQLAQGILVSNGDAEDTPMTRATIIGNECYFPNATGGVCISAPTGANHVIANNVATLSAAVAGFTLAPLTAFDYFDYNHIYFPSGSGNYSNTHSTLTAFRAAGRGLNDSTGNPLYVATPSSSNNYNQAKQAGSPLINSGVVPSGFAWATKFDALGCLANSTLDKGTVEYLPSQCFPNRYAPTGLR